jgi:hypothetical protein
VSPRAWTVLHAVVVAGFLATVASYYQSPFGFTAFLLLPIDRQDDYELAAIRAVPHVEDPSGGYDAQFYVRLAVEPLLRDPAIDKTLDHAPYRARRILLSWTAWTLGFGKPKWVLEAFALQNVLAWLGLAWVLLRWFPIGSARSFALWSGCLLTHGLLGSVRQALLDGPSVLMLAAAVAAVERGRPWIATAITAASGLARETNLLAVTLFGRYLRRTPRSWIRVSLYVMLSVLPLLLWIDYLRSLYLSRVLATDGNLTTPLTGLWFEISTTARQGGSAGFDRSLLFNACAVVAFVVQATYVATVAARRAGGGSGWLPIAASFAVLGLLAHPVVWDGAPGAITRLMLPLAVGFNVLARRAPWPVLAVGNLGVVPGVLVFVFRF